MCLVGWLLACSCCDYAPDSYSTRPWGRADLPNRPGRDWGGWGVTETANQRNGFQDWRAHHRPDLCKSAFWSASSYIWAYTAKCAQSCACHQHRRNLTDHWWHYGDFPCLQSSRQLTRHIVRKRSPKCPVLQKLREEKNKERTEWMGKRSLLNWSIWLKQLFLLSVCFSSHSCRPRVLSLCKENSVLWVYLRQMFARPILPLFHQSSFWSNCTVFSVTVKCAAIINEASKQFWTVTWGERERWQKWGWCLIWVYSQHLSFVLWHCIVLAAVTIRFELNLVLINECLGAVCDRPWILQAKWLHSTHWNGDSDCHTNQQGFCTATSRKSRKNCTRKMFQAIHLVFLSAWTRG